jgi:hypothetical protein
MNNDNSNKHMVLQVLVHGRRVAGNTLNIDIGKVASNAAMKNATLLYTSCYAGNHVERMYDTTFAEATGEVYTDAGGTSAFMNTRESMKYRLADAYNTEIPMEPGEPDRQGKCPGDLNRDGTVTRAEAMSWLDRHSSLHDGHGYIAGKQVF